jgi:four helix bundle protein
MNSRIRTFEDLVVWQKAIAFVKQVYLITDEGGLKRDFGLKDQLRRAAVSIPTNIAEGFERASQKGILAFSKYRQKISWRSKKSLSSVLRCGLSGSVDLR